MRLFRRRGGEEPGDAGGVPEWAAPLFDEAGWAAFLGEVSRVLDGMGLRHEIDPDGALRVEGSDGQYGLANLAQQCAAEPREEWAGLIGSHFRQLVAAEARDVDAMPAEEALEVLRVRLWPRADVPPTAEFLARPVADDLLAVLSLDLPETVVTVHPDTAAEWGLDEDALFERAAAQTRADPDVESEVVPDEEDGSEVVFAVGDSFFTSSQALWPGRLLGDRLGEHGALVAVPNRHLAALHAIADERVLGVTSRLAPFVAARYDEGPGSISPHLYWWREGELLRIEVAIEGDKVSITPPEEFVELLNGLAGP